MALEDKKLYKTMKGKITGYINRSNKNLQITKQICISLYQDIKYTEILINIAKTIINTKNLIFTMTPEVKTEDNKKYVYAA